MTYSSASGAPRFRLRRADRHDPAADEEYGTLNRPAPSGRPAFATRAHARLLDALGWKVADSPRRETKSHPPLQCCFVLRDGMREEAAFGYTGLTGPLDTDDACLRAARTRVERFLSILGEDRGVLLQNEPLLAFGRNGDRVAVFGGWRFLKGVWKPFVLGPDGLGGVAAQEMLFESGTAPQHMAEICGSAAATALPRIAETLRAIRTLEAGRGAGTDDVAVLRFRPHGSGWFSARLGPVRGRTGGAPVRVGALHGRKGEQENRAGTDEFRLIANAGLPPSSTAPPSPPADLPRSDEGRRLSCGMAWEAGADEFRFRGPGAAEVRK